MKDPYFVGATNLIRSLDLEANDGLIIFSCEEAKEFASHILKATKIEGLGNVINIVQPNIFRPALKIPDLLIRMIENSGGLIYLIDRRAEENFTFNRPLQDLCTKNECKFVFTYDPKIRYLKEGIAADYIQVFKKAKKIKELLEKSKKLMIKSDLGTDLTLSLYTHNIIPRSPIFNKGMFWNQAPEGEVMTCPFERSFNGRLVVDGVVTGLGVPPESVVWDFKDGVVQNVEGNPNFLIDLLKMLKKSDPRLEALVGMWIAELSIGCNDWAVFDDNISNCEKVSGGVHFGIGNSEGLGEDRGETYHFDSIVKSPSITVVEKNDEKVELIKNGKLLITTE